MNIDLIALVYSDLTYLKEEWIDISDDKLRRNSTVLRHLISHDNLLKAWYEIGFRHKCILRATSLNRHLSVLPNKKIRFAYAGGAKFNGTIVGSVAETDPLSDVEKEAFWEIMMDQSKAYEDISLNRFKDMIVIKIRDENFTRLEIIDFVANKLGAAHFDQKRTAKQALLDSLLSNVTVNNKNSIYYQLLSTGQFLVQSDDIVTFMDKAKGIIG